MVETKHKFKHHLWIELRVYTTPVIGIKKYVVWTENFDDFFDYLFFVYANTQAKFSMNVKSLFENIYFKIRAIFELYGKSITIRKLISSQMDEKWDIILNYFIFFFHLILFISFCSNTNLIKIAEKKKTGAIIF